MTQFSAPAADFVVAHRGYHYAPTALRDPMTKAFLDGIHGFVAARGLELISLARGRRKDDIAHEFLTRFTDQEGLLCVGRPGEGGPVAHPTPPQRRDRRRLRPVVPWCPWRSLLIIDLGITIVWAQAMYSSEPA